MSWFAFITNCCFAVGRMWVDCRSAHIRAFEGGSLHWVIYNQPHAVPHHLLSGQLNQESYVNDQRNYGEWLRSSELPTPLPFQRKFRNKLSGEDQRPPHLIPGEIHNETLRRYQLIYNQVKTLEYVLQHHVKPNRVLQPESVPRHIQTSMVDRESPIRPPSLNGDKLMKEFYDTF
jgi:hypothetical protein